MGGMNGMMGGFGILGILFWIALIALAVWAVGRVLRSRNDDEALRHQRDPAEETLRERYARGEIDAEEYESSLATLRGRERAHDNDGRR